MGLVVSGEENPVKCVICRQGETKHGVATASLTRDNTTIVVKDVPAHICGNCGEEYFDEDVTRRLLTVAEEAARAGIEVVVRHFAAA
jgi:YgiT-type zinc finger domain-containing protein